MFLVGSPILCPTGGYPIPRGETPVVAPVTSTMFWTFLDTILLAAAQISLQLVFFRIVQKLLGPRPETTDTEDQGIHSDDVAPVSQPH